MLSVTEKYTIRAFEPRDKPALFKLMAEIWGGASSAKVENRWWWNYDPPPIMLAVDNERDAPVGLCAFRSFQTYYQGSNHRGVWAADLFVLPAHHRQGLGKRLVKEISSNFDIAAGLSMTDAAWATFRGLGWQERRYVPLFLSPWLLLTPWLERILTIRRNGKQIDITTHDSPTLQFDESFDDLWLRARDAVAPSAVRDASNLKERYTRDPKRRYVVLKCVKQGLLVGYMILRILPPDSIKALPKFRVGLVVDYLVDGNPLIFSRLLDAAALWFARGGVPLMLCLSNHPAEQQQLHKRGFIGPETPLLRRKLQKLALGFTFVSFVDTGSPGDQAWYLTSGDADMDLDLGGEHLA